MDDLRKYVQEKMGNVLWLNPGLCGPPAVPSGDHHDDGGTHRRTAPGGEDFPSPRGQVMELGVTASLRKVPERTKTPAYGTEPDRRFCWDLHVVDRPAGAQMPAGCPLHSRYSFVRYDVAPVQWADLPGTVPGGTG